MTLSSERTLRILLSIHHPLDRDSGAAGVVMRTAEELCRLGHHASVVSYDDIPTIIPDRFRGLAFPFVLERTIARLRPDVVDASSGDGWFAFSSRSTRGRLRVTHSHGLEHLSSEREIADQNAGGHAISLGKRLWRHGLRLRLVARSFARADLSFVLNDAEADRLRSCAGVALSAVRRIRLGTDHAGIALPDGARDPSAIVQIGAYSERKGVKVTAAAMRQVMAVTPLASITFIGTGVHRSVVLADYPTCFHDRIHVIERYANTDLPALLAGSTICLMPSLFEGYGIAKLEAMACGLALVVSDDPGAQKDIRDKENGLVVARNDVEGLRDTVIYLIENPVQASDIGWAGSVTASYFSWSNVTSERLANYKDYLRISSEGQSGSRTH